MSEIEQYIVDKLETNYKIKNKENISAINFVEEGYVTSLGLVQFIVELEDHFAIEFTDEELASTEFKVIGKLSEIIQNKLDKKK